MTSTITKRPYRSLVDFNQVYNFLLRNYTVDWRRGFPAPYFEYAQVLHWTDLKNTHRFALWEDRDELVAFCCYEQHPGEAYFCISDGYETLIPEMIEHAETKLRAHDGSLVFCPFSSQVAVREALSAQGYARTDFWEEKVYDYSKGPLDSRLPEGFSFVPAAEIDSAKLERMTWRGFDNGPSDDPDYFHGDAIDFLRNSPHCTADLDVLISAANGDYACFAGMWMTPENRLAYLEPLCTAPEYRRMGLAAAALSELYRRTEPLGATHMTGGDHLFYSALGFEPRFEYERWRKQ